MSMNCSILCAVIYVVLVCVTTEKTEFQKIFYSRHDQNMNNSPS